MILLDADLLCPDVIGLVIVQKYRYIQFVHRHLHFLGNKLPGPLTSFPLEVISKGEVAQHLKIGAMTGILAHAVDIQGTDALLAVGDPGGRRGELAGEIMLQRCNTGVDEQQGIVVLGHQGKTFQPQVALAFKKAEKPLSDFIESQFFHGSSLHPCYFSSFSTRRRKKAFSCTCVN